MAGRVRVRFDADTRNLERGTKRAESAVAGMGKKAIAAGAGFLSLGVGVNELRKSVNTVTTLAKGTAALSRQTGMDTRESSRWVAVAKSRNIEAAKVGTSFTALSKQVKAAVDGNKTARKTFTELGVSMDTLKTGNVSQIVGQISDRMQKLGPGTERSALASKVFGKSYQALLPLLADGKVKLEEALSAADKYGLSLSKGQVKTALEAAKAQREMNMAMDGLRVAVALSVLPSLTAATGSVATFINQVRTGEGLVGNFAHNLIGLSANFLTSRTAVVLLGAAIGGLTARTVMLTAAFVASKITAFVTALRQLGAVISAMAIARSFAEMRVAIAAAGATMTLSLGPIGVLIGVLGGLALALGATSSKQKQVAVSADEARSALDRQLQAMRGVRDFELDSQDAHLRYKQAQINVRDAVRQRTAAESQFGRNSDQWRSANIRVKQSVIERTRAQRAANDTDREGTDRTRQLRDANRSAIDTAAKRVQTTRDEISSLRFAVSWLRKRGASEQDLLPLMRRLGEKQRDNRDAIDDYRAAQKRAQRSNREMGGSVGNLSDTWAGFVTGFADSVNNTLDKLGATRLHFKMPNFFGAGHAEGGYIAGPSKRDVVPAMLGAGEAVVNLHQQPYVNRSMAFAQAAGVVPYGSLPELFSSVTTPNYFARGGIGGINEGGAAKVRAAARKYINKHSLTGVGNIVTLGRRLQHMGYAVGEHPSFGGVKPVHGKGSYHYRSRAIDVNADGWPGGEPRALDRLHSQLRRNPHVAELLWRVKDHYDHLHVAMNRGGYVGFAPGGIAKKKKKKEQTPAQRRRTATHKRVEAFQRRAELDDALDEAYDSPKYTVDLRRRLKSVDKLLGARGLPRDDKVALLQMRAQIMSALSESSDAADTAADSAVPTVDDSANIQARLDQANTRLVVSQKAEQIARGALGVFKGSGDIGYGSGNVIVQTLHPGDPRTLAAIGQAAAAGFAGQGSIQSTKVPTAI